jgi:uncharacterized protein (UPF0333 family)
MLEKKRYKKGQVSVEYAMLIGFIGLALALAITVAFFYSSSARQQIRMNQIDKIGNKIIENAESVYYLGYPSMVTIDLTMPDAVETINIVNGSTNYLEFIYRGSGGDAYAVYYTNAKLLNTTNGVYQPLNVDRFKSSGLKHLKISATAEGAIEFDTGFT